MYRRLSLLLPVLLVTASLLAQVNSPYSRYGLGNIYPSTFGAANGMGGMSAAYFMPFNINYQNPASYADLAGASLDLGINGSLITLNTDQDNFTSGDGNLSNIAFGFPMLKASRKHRMGLGFGLIPYSAFQYDILEEIPTDDPDLGTKQYDYVGDGELYQVFGGLGYKYATDTTIDHKQFIRAKDTMQIEIVRANMFSVGANAALLFGSLYNITYASFPDIVNAQTTKLTRDNDVNGGMFNFGVGYQRQYIRKIKKTSDLLTWKFGAAASPGVVVDGTQSVLWTNILKNGNYEFVTDTIYSAPDTSGAITLPMSYQAGLMFTFNSTNDTLTEYAIAAQFNMTQWSDYAGFQDVGNFADSWRMSLGAEIKPGNKSEKSEDKYKPRFAYRVGVYSGKSYLVVDGIQMNDYGFTSGVAIPLGRGENVAGTFVNSKLNLFLNVGQRGGNTNLSETYYNFGVNFSIVDMGWFIKYKLN